MSDEIGCQRLVNIRIEPRNRWSVLDCPMNVLFPSIQAFGIRLFLHVAIDLLSLDLKGPRENMRHRRKFETYSIPASGALGEILFIPWLRLRVGETEMSGIPRYADFLQIHRILREMYAFGYLFEHSPGMLCFPTSCLSTTPNECGPIRTGVA